MMNALPEESQAASAAQLNESRAKVEPAQEKIYSFFLKIVKTWNPEAVLQEFKYVFITPVHCVNSEVLQALYEIIFYDDEQVFRNTLKRTCYILINNWWVGRQNDTIKKLIDLFQPIKNENHTLSFPVKHLNKWLQNFVESQDYQDLNLVYSAFENREKGYWIHRYASYLLAPQYLDLRNPIEQREATKKIANQLKEKFKFDLAMYTAHSQAIDTQNTPAKNPTRLGDEAIHLIKKIIAKQGLFSHANLAHIFINQNQQVDYKNFKNNFQKYLLSFLELENPVFLNTLKAELAQKLTVLYETYHQKTLNDELLLRTCDRALDYLTTEKHGEPSPLFILLLAQGEKLTLAILLLKIILICNNARSHLEFQIAKLIHYYESYSEEECEGIINFLEVFNLVFTIYAEDIEFNLVNLKDEATEHQAIADLDECRIFSQLKCELNLVGTNLSDTDLHGIDLHGVNLHGAKLNHTNLSGADLSNANLSDANFRHAKVHLARFGNNLGLSEDKKLKLTWRGAIFDPN